MRKKKMSKIMKRTVIVCVFLLSAGVIALGVMLWLATGSYRGEAARVYIPAGATSGQIMDSLSSSLSEGYARKVYRLWRMQGGQADVAHGSYVVNQGTKAISLSRRLLQGRQTPVKFTFNNIRTLSQLAARADSRMEFSDSAFIAACDSVLPPLGFNREGYPAAFLPDTYEFYWSDSAVKVVEELVDVRDRFWNGERRQKAKSLGLTPVDVATVASIIEEETAKKDEKPLVARLYLNRLAAGMPLQADPTVKFAVGDFSLRRIRGEHLKTESPYNTYRRRGLPPGPIRIPERSSIDDVLSAPSHPYVYMCAKEDFSGYHNFARDYATHMANARRYQAALNARGIR